MPIARELRYLYRKPEWFAARKICLDRANGRCEWCGKPKGDVRQALDRTGRWFDEETHSWRRPPAFGKPGAEQLGMEKPKRVEFRRCILGAAHLDHNPENNAEANLAGLCGRCHLLYDGPHHRQTARLRRDFKSGQLRLELIG